MLPKILIASSLVLASGSALALDEFISQPRVSITFGGGGHHEYGHSVTRYREVYVPRPVHVQPVYYDNYYRGQNRHHREWREQGHQRRYQREHHD